MAFSDFKYPTVLTDLGLSLNNSPNLFATVPAIPPSLVLRETLEANWPLAATGSTEMARATWLVGPVLSNFWVRYGGRISLFSGVDFAADPEAGLTGYCDFLIGLAPQQPTITAPAILIFEAKRDSIIDGLGQCIAAMVGAQRYNLREGKPIDPIFGCVTTGSLWRFLRLSGSALKLDLTEYSLDKVDKLLGILTHIVGPVPEPAAA